LHTSRAETLPALIMPVHPAPGLRHIENCWPLSACFARPKASGTTRVIEEKVKVMSRLLEMPVAPQKRQGSGMNRLDELNRILRKLQIDSPGIETSALISEDGLMIARADNMNMEETRVAGMAATLLNLGTRAAMELSRGSVQEVIVRGENGYAVVLSAGRGTLLLAVTNESSKLGLIFFDMREAIRALQKVL